MNILRNRPVRLVIDVDFDGDREAAVEAATLIAKTYAPEKLPAWVYELSRVTPKAPSSSRLIRRPSRKEQGRPVFPS
jgi:hypothetical protein